MTDTMERPLSPLERESKDGLVTGLRALVREIAADPDQRWTDAQRLAIHLASEELKTFIQDWRKK